MEKNRTKKSFADFLYALPTHIKVQLWLLLLLPLNVALVSLAESFPQLVENIYAEKIRPVVMSAVSRVTGLLPFSLAEVLVISAVFCAVLFLTLAVVGLVRTVRRKESVAVKLIDYASRLTAVLLCGVLLFNLMYGLCYYRENTCLSVSRYHIAYETDDIAHVATYITEELNEVRREAGLDEDEPYSFCLTTEEISEACRQAYRSAAEDYPVYGGEYGNPKPVALSKPWTYTFVMGMYFPFTGEANYNTNIPSVELPHTVLHEMAHQRGIAAEDEANFAAFLVGRYCEDARVKYSAVFEAWLTVMNTLWKQSPTLYEQILSLADEGAQRDVAYVDSFWASYDTSLADFSDEVNRAYLESNGVEYGTMSYGLSVQYILDYYTNTYLADHIILSE